MDILQQVVRLETTLWNLIERALIRNGHGGLGTFLALRALHRYDGFARVHDLSLDLSITIGAASKVVDRLERDGLVRRRPHPDDRRSSLISLTAEGELARDAADGVVRRVVAETFGDDDLIATGAAMLDRLQARVDSASMAVSA